MRFLFMLWPLWWYGTTVMCLPTPGNSTSSISTSAIPTATMSSGGTPQETVQLDDPFPVVNSSGTVTATMSGSVTPASPTFALPPSNAGSVPGPIPASIPHGQNAAQRQECLAAHNKVRANVAQVSPKGVAPRPLTYDTNLEEIACRWAKHCADTGSINHSYGAIGWYGENIYRSWRSTPYPKAQGPELGSCAKAVVAWAGEIKYYKPGYRIGVDGEYHQYGHYTQLVWPTTARVGCCAWQSADVKSLYWVCEYSPYGNIARQAAY